MSEIKLMRRTPFRALLVQEVEPNRYRLVLWGVRWGDFKLPDICNRPRSLAAVKASALAIHRKVGLPLTFQRLGNPVRSFRSGEFW